MNIDELELAARRAWPALEEVDTELGVLRFAAGVSRRANSLSPSRAGCANPEPVRELAASWFQSRGLAPVIRVIETEQQDALALDRALDTAGYQREAPTAVMVKRLYGRQPAATGRGQAVTIATWLQAWYQLRALAPEDLPVQQRMLAGITDPCCALVVTGDSAVPIASALGVVSQGLLGVFGVATAVHARRQGFAASLIEQLCDWGVEQGARSAYLQVEIGNRPAMTLYRSLGFEAAYHYWFRIGAQPAHGSAVPGTCCDGNPLQEART